MLHALPVSPLLYLITIIVREEYTRLRVAQSVGDGRPGFDFR